MRLMVGALAPLKLGRNEVGEWLITLAGNRRREACLEQHAAMCAPDQPNPHHSWRRGSRVFCLPVGPSVSLVTAVNGRDALVSAVLRLSLVIGRRNCRSHRRRASRPDLIDSGAAMQWSNFDSMIDDLGPLWLHFIDVEP